MPTDLPTPGSPLDALVRAMPLGVHVYAEEEGRLRLVDTNAAAEAMTGMPRDRALGRWLEDVLPALPVQGVTARLLRAARGGEPLEAAEVRLQEGAGIFALRAFGLPDGRLAVMFEDVTERLRVEDAVLRLSWQVAEAREAAEEANRAKSMFLANMSHELRTPLNAIIGYTELVRESVADGGAIDRAEMNEDLVKIERAGHHLLGLIDDVLDLAKIEAGKLEVVLEPCATAALLRDTVQTVVPLVRKRHNALTFAVGDDVPPVRADGGRLRQVVLNLLSNACKFTGDGRITVEAGAADRQGVPGVAIRVRDTGVGMDAAQLARLFTPFVQGQITTARQHGGTGLGLALSRRLCRLMAGELTVVSEPNVGSTFEVWLPADVQLGASPRPARAAA